MRKTCTLLFLAMAASAAACGGGEREAEPLTPAAQVQGSNVRSAADSIASARCDRSQRCNHIGQGGEYSDREHCLSVARPKAEEQLGVCPRGVDQDDLRECLTQIANQDCDAPLDNMQELMACGVDDLCED